MTRESDRTALADALDALERALEAPVVPGETEPRAENVRVLVDAAKDVFVSHARRDHGSALSQIGEADAALLHRVDRMKEEDDALVRSWRRAATAASELRDAAAARPGDERAFRQGFRDYAPRALALVLRTRAQEAALRTWTHEAFQRDRGGGD